MKNKYVLGLECKNCGKAAFYLFKQPEGGSVINPEDAFVVKGEKPTRGKLIKCQWCGYMIKSLKRTHEIIGSVAKFNKQNGIRKQ